MSKNLKLTLIILVAFQVLVSAGFELAHDEAYYWLYSKNLAWGYFDHPPFVAWTIKAFSFLPHSEWAIRLGFIVLQFGTLLILLRLIADKFRWLATALFFAFPLASFTGLLALPDMPLLFMTAVYLWCLKNYLEEDQSKNIVLMGISIPALLYAKYHGILIVFFTLVALPKLLKRKSFYLVALLSIVLFFPHIWWQYEHNFSTLRYHFLERPSSSFSLARSADFLLVQLILSGLLVSPVVWWTSLKNKSADDFERVLKTIAAGTILFFLFSSFSKKTEANWTISLAIPLILLTLKSEIWEKKLWRNLAYASALICILARLVFVFSPETLRFRRLAEFHGWKEWAKTVQANCEGRPILANTYQVASKLSFYLNQEIPSLNYQSRRNQFDVWRFDLSYTDQNVCYVTNKSQFPGADLISPDGRVLKVVTEIDLKSLQDKVYRDRSN